MTSPSVRTRSRTALLVGRALLAVGLALLGFCVSAFVWADNAQEGPGVTAGEGEAMFAFLVGLPAGLIGVMLVIAGLAALLRRRPRR